MKVVRVEPLLSTGRFPSTAAFARAQKDVLDAVAAIRWPPAGPDFTIYPQSGKKRGEGNGVRPIKQAFVATLQQHGWELERHGTARLEAPGAFDAYLDLAPEPAFVTEWETGNISSTHRALNKIALGMLQKWLSGGFVVLPSRSLYRYLTDRVGNYPEIAPYFPLWQSLPVDDGHLAVIEVEHDSTSVEVPRIAKGTDGRALI